MISEQNHWVGRGVDRVYHPGNAEITVGGSTSEVTVLVSGGNRDDDFRLEFAAPDGETLAVGSYEHAQGINNRDEGRPGINVAGNGFGCWDSGRFEVKDIEASPDGDIESLWILYEHHCGDSSNPAVFGGVRYRAPGDGGRAMVAPREVRWPPAERGEPSVDVPITVVNRADGDVTLGASSVSGPDADLFFVSSDGCAGRSLLPDGSCRVWVDYRTARSGSHEAHLTVPERSGVAHTIPLSGSVFGGVTRFVMEGEEREYISGGERYSYDPSNATMFVRGGYGSVSVSVDEGHETPADTYWNVVFKPPEGSALTPGTRYEGATSAAFSGPGPGLSVDGSGRGCNKLTGWFEISDISVDPEGLIDRFGAAFEQSCDGGPRLYGVVDFRMPSETSWPDPSSFESSPTPSSGSSPSPSPSPSSSPTPTLRPKQVTDDDDTDYVRQRAKTAWTHAPRGAFNKPRVVLKLMGRPRFRVSRKGAVAHAGGAHGRKVVYEQRRRPRSYNNQIRLYHTRRRSHQRLPAGVNTPHFESAPVVWGRWLAFTRYKQLSVRRARSTLRLMNLKTGQQEVLEARRGTDSELVSGQMAGRYLTWSRCTDECDVVTYDRWRSVKRRVPKPAGDVYQYAPSITKEGTVYFARSGPDCGDDVGLYRFTTAGGSEKVFQLPDRMDLRGSWVVGRSSDSVYLYIDAVDCETGGYDIYYMALPKE